MDWIKQLDWYNLVGIYDVLLDIRQEKQLSHSNIQIPILKNPVLFQELFPADSIPMRDRYCALRWKVILLLKEKGVINDYVLVQIGGHRWNNNVQVDVDHEKFDQFFKKIETEYKHREKTREQDEEKSLDFWDYFHPKIIEISKSRYESGHYADAVEAVFKEINNLIKEVVKKKTGQEYDGADLMNKAFSLTSPIIILDDLDTETGKNIQKGYMQMFAGAMIGIRNPKAHHNLKIDYKRAIHFLFFASLLLFKLDERK